MNFRRLILAIALCAPVVAGPATAAAQGCSLCRDATAGSAPRVRKALRRAIPFLGIPAIAIFAGSLLLARYIKPGQHTN